jgi:membrane protein DedA with SNARE-associated domain
MMHDLIQMIFHASPLLVFLLVAVILLLESSAVPLINTTLLLAAGALASQGHLNFWVLLAAAILGSISGACLAYVIGLRGGRHIFLRLAALFHIDAQKVNMTERWFQKNGVWMVFFSRMMPYVRPFACFPAGISRMSFSRFFLAALVGSTIWCVVMLNIGLTLGRRWPLAIHLIRHYTVPTLCILALLIALYFLITSAVKRYLRSQAGTAPDSMDEDLAGASPATTYDTRSPISPYVKEKDW